MDDTGQSSQTECPLGSYQESTGQISCDGASAGHSVGLTGQSEPVECALGTYQAHIGQSSCNDASLGYYVDTTGATSQIAADVGHYVGSTGESYQIECSVGTYQDTQVSLSATTIPVSMWLLLQAPPRPYAPRAPIKHPSARRRAITPTAHYVSTAGQISQTACAAGTYQPSIGQASCNDAGVGFYVDSTASTSQTAEAGSYQPSTGQTSCDDADAGHYVDSTASTSQTACAAGTYQPDTGQTSRHRRSRSLRRLDGKHQPDRMLCRHIPGIHRPDVVRRSRRRPLRGFRGF